MIKHNIWTQPGLSFSPDHARSTGHNPDNTGHCYYVDPIQQNLSRHSHDCNRPHKIGCVSRMLRDAPNCRECLTDLSGPFPRTLLRTYTTAFRKWHCRSLRIVIRLFRCSCSSAVWSRTGAIIDSVNAALYILIQIWLSGHESAKCAIKDGIKIVKEWLRLNTDWKRRHLGVMIFMCYRVNI